MWVALCSGCGQFFLIGPKAEAIIAEGEGTTEGYCAIVRQRVPMELALDIIE
jgi:hypothetical protein